MLSVHREIKGIYVKGSHPALSGLVERAATFRVYVNFSRSSVSPRRKVRPTVKRVSGTVYTRNLHYRTLTFLHPEDQRAIFGQYPYVVHPMDSRPIDAERVGAYCPARLFIPSPVSQTQNHWPYKISRSPVLWLGA